MIDSSTVLLIYGVILLVMSVKFLKEPKEISRIVREMLASHCLIFLAGFLALVFGLITMFAFMPEIHTSHTALLTTIIGGFLSLAGIVRLWFTDLWCKIVKKYSHSKYLNLVIGIYFLIGMLLLLIGGGIIPLQ